MPSYPSSLTDAEWEFVRDMVPQSRPSEGRGRPCTWSKREILDAIFYVVRGGIQWRMIPNDPHGDRQTLQFAEGIQGVAETMDRGADLRLADPQQTTGS